MKTNKKNQKTIGKRTLLFMVFALFAAALMLFLYKYPPNIHTSKEQKMPNHTIPYVDGSEATQHVQSFFDNYINPKRTQVQRKTSVAIFGSKNLVFYNEYYQHGFDPITCSTSLPSKVTAALDSTGPVAHVNATVRYADNSQAAINATVVLNDDGMQIDSITCPDDKSSLAPVNTP